MHSRRQKRYVRHRNICAERCPATCPVHGVATAYDRSFTGSWHWFGWVLQGTASGNYSHNLLFVRPVCKPNNKVRVKLPGSKRISNLQAVIEASLLPQRQQQNVSLITLILKCSGSQPLYCSNRILVLKMFGDPPPNLVS